MALKADKKPNRVVCLVGDGELQAGQLWEAALVARQYKLDNLTLIVDWNGLQMDGVVRSVVDIDPIAEKFDAFGWKIVLVTDGHNFEDLLIGIEKAYEVQRRPTVIVARTVKGKGVAFAENKPFYHAEVLSDEEMAVAVPNLEQQLQAFDQPM
jgi:transketolase